MKKSCFLFLSAFFFAAPCPGETYDIKPNRDAPEDQWVHVDASGIPPSKNSPGYGYVRLVLENFLPKKRNLTINLTCGESHGRRYNSFNVSKSLFIEPSGTAELFLPFPTVSGPPPILNFELGGSRPQGSFFTAGKAVRNHSVLLVTDTRDLASSWKHYLTPLRLFLKSGKRLSRSGRHRVRSTRSSKPAIPEKLRAWSKKPFGTPLPSSFSLSDDFVTLVTQRASSIPSDWRYLTGFSLIIVDCRSSSLTKEKQKALQNYERAGGRIILQFASALRAGPLKETFLEQKAGSEATKQEVTISGSSGFGAFIALPDKSGSALKLKNWIEQFWKVCDREEEGVFKSSGLFPSQIPGVDRTPTGIFAVLIVLFVLLAGPLNFFFCLRRQRSPGMLLITLPAAGFSFTLFILAYGFLREGFGIKGVIFSSTILDQRSYEKVEHVLRTLYAGLPPARISPKTDTAIANPCKSYLGKPRIAEMDLDHGGRLSGTIIPARTPTALPSITVSRARERLRFQRRPDGGLAVLAGRDFRPASGTYIVLRDFDGSWYLGKASRSLKPANKETISRHLDHTAKKAHRLRRLSSFAAETYTRSLFHRHRRHYYPSSPRAQNEIERKLPFDPADIRYFKPGSYLAVMGSIPSLDTLGLNVNYLKHHHLVYGILAKEDIVE